jgi:hypothetical protein
MAVIQPSNSYAKDFSLSQSGLNTTKEKND